jgi:hypothetical protein
MVDRFPEQAQQDAVREEIQSALRTFALELAAREKGSAQSTAGDQGDTSTPPKVRQVRAQLELTETKLDDFCEMVL